MLFLYKFTDTLARLVLWSFTITVIVLALLTSLLRYYLPQADEYKTTVFALIAEHTSWEISADTVQASWHSFRPNLQFTQLTLRQKETGQQLQFADLAIELNLVKSVIFQRFYIDNLTADNLAIFLSQNQQGKWQISTAAAKASSTSIDTLLDKFWSIDTLSLSNIQLNMTPYDKKTLQLPKTHISLQTWLNEKILEIEQVEDKQYSKLVLQTLNHYQDTNFSAHIYWQTTGFPLHLLLPLIKNVTIHKESRISQQVWLSWENQQLTGSGEFAVDSMSLDYAGKAWHAKKLSGSFGITKEAQQTVIAIPSLKVALNQQPLQLDKIKIGIGKQNTLQIEQLDLAKINQYLQLVSLSPELQELSNDLHPTGKLTHLLVTLPSASTAFLLQANLAHVSVGAWKGAPALQNVSGYVEAQKLAGFVQLDSTDFSMAFPKLYDTAMPFSNARGNVFWHIGKTIQVGTSGLVHLNGQYGQAKGEFQLDMPLQHELHLEPGRISIVVDLQQGNARYRKELIPKTVDAHLLDWLDNNIIAGTIPHGSFIYHGPIDDIGDEEKVVQLWLEAKNTTIRYQPTFPVVEAMNGEFILDQQDAKATISSASSAGLHLQQGELALSITPNNRLLTVNFALPVQSTQALLGFLQQPSFSTYSHDILQAWRSTQGKFNAKVAVNVPLDNIDNLNIDVNATLQNAQLQIATPELTFTHIQGDLHFNLQHGFSTKQIRASLWDQVVSADIQAENGINTLHFGLAVSDNNLQQWLKLPILSFLQGQSHIDGRLVWGANTQAQLDISSDLTGFNIALPTPFAKTAQQQRAFHLTLPLTEKQQELSMLIDEGMHLQLLIDDNGIRAGRLNLGLGDNDYHTGLFRVQGQVLDIDAAQWVEIVNRYEQLSSQQASNTALQFQVDKLSIRKLHFGKYAVENAHFSAIEQNAGWGLSLQQEKLKARLFIPRDNSPLVLSADLIDIDLFKQSQSTLENTVLESTTATNLPTINVAIEKLVHDKDALGKWSFVIKPSANGVLLDSIIGDIRDTHLDALNADTPCSLHWITQPSERSEFNCRLTSDNIDDALAAWGFEKLIISKKSQIDIVDSYWNGSPLDFSFTNSVIPFSVKLDKGHFADISSAQTDAMKALGFFDINNLIRRLKLDFSDLSQQGLTFDKVRGDLLMQHGIVKSQSPLTIKGASSEITMQGSADFNTDNVDIDMSVNLPFVSNLPWMVSLAAGLPVAAVVFVISKLLGKQVSHLTTAIYKVTGSLEKPKIKFQHFFGTTDKQQKQTTKVTDEQSK